MVTKTKTAPPANDDFAALIAVATVETKKIDRTSIDVPQSYIDAIERAFKENASITIPVSSTEDYEKHATYLRAAADRSTFGISARVLPRYTQENEDDEPVLVGLKFTASKRRGPVLGSKNTPKTETTKTEAANDTAEVTSEPTDSE
jgi:hypothetical protein